MSHTLTAVLALAALVGAQLPSPQDIERRVVVANLTSHARYDVVTSVVPWPLGRYHGEPLRLADGGPVQHRRLGALWSDGSWRQSVVHFPARLGPETEAPIRLVVAGSGARPGFTWSPALVRGAASLALALKVGDQVIPFTDWRVVESGHVVKCWRARGTASPMWADLWLQVGTGATHARWWLWYGASSTGVPQQVHDVGPIELVIRGGSPVLHYQEGKLLGQRTEAGAAVLRLQNAGRWCEGESQALRGRVLFHDPADPQTVAAESVLPVLACSPDWPDSGAYGPWGYVAPPPEGFDRAASWARAARDWASWGRGDPWEEGRHLCRLNPRGTGDQPGFGLVHLTAEAHGYPARLFSYGRSVFQEACRPTTLRHPDGSWVRLGSEPDLHLWSGQLFKTSPNRLGKAEMPPGTMHGHQSHDRAHYAANDAYWSLLTGDRLGLEMLGWRSELWLGEMQTASGNVTIDSMGSARGCGRSLRAGVMLYLVTGREDLAQRIRDRVDRTAQQWRGSSTAPVRPLVVQDADPRKMGGRWDFWVPWETQLGVGGLDSVAQVLGYAPAADLAALAGASQSLHGQWSHLGVIGTGDSVAWSGGAALSPAQIARGMRELPMRSDGSFDVTLFNEWAYGGAVVAARRASGLAAAAAQALVDQVDVAPMTFRSAEWRSVR